MEKSIILVVDDDKDIRDMINIYLVNQGMNVYTAANGIEALDILKNIKVDLIILDIMMPKMDGIKACMKIREMLNVPIIILSAKIDEADKILGLTIGADDYVGKPFSPLELLARIKSQLRRYKQLNNNFKNTTKEVIQIDELSINISNHEAFLRDKQIKLTPYEFKILVLLAQNRGRVFSIASIYESVWEEDYMASDRTVTVHIRRIRKKIGKEYNYIKTVWGVGYKIEN
ncbi:response regulator transcription factor [Clostridium botulinum]|uniref:Stage 0 sporulation protein A homolog n=1 Tax=Clostridium botulinum TaxID=1491 RepID=A0A6B4BHH3_CLOBO|nr:response regulator transcription factor [Clostridium botulinum]NFD83087.1 response regulator transcription factor [Clostridium botulinum]NFE07412.1 response regulator transcription factor [Clostridium botulinum]NFE33330.1 response regulator transcription factor [Clostridium botulinum]NFE49537.1 response regulator transcription factor [Clostridium botulinum]